MTINNFIGKNVFLRTVTHHYTGRLTAVSKRWLTLEDAAWIADDGRFSACLANGTPTEIEPFPAGPVLIGAGSVIDLTSWAHDLHRTVK